MIITKGDMLFGIWCLRGLFQQMLVSVVQTETSWHLEYKLHIDDSDYNDEIVDTELPLSTTCKEVYERVNTFLDELMESGFGKDLYAKIVISKHPKYIKHVLKEYKLM